MSRDLITLEQPICINILVNGDLAIDIIVRFNVPNNEVNVNFLKTLK